MVQLAIYWGGTITNGPEGVGYSTGPGLRFEVGPAASLDYVRSFIYPYIGYSPSQCSLQVSAKVNVGQVGTFYSLFRMENDNMLSMALQRNPSLLELYVEIIPNVSNATYFPSASALPSSSSQPRYRPQSPPHYPPHYPPQYPGYPPHYMPQYPGQYPAHCMPQYPGYPPYYQPYNQPPQYQPYNQPPQYQPAEATYPNQDDDEAVNSPLQPPGYEDYHAGGEDPYVDFSRGYENVQERTPSPPREHTPIRESPPREHTPIRARAPTPTPTDDEDEEDEQDYGVFFEEDELEDMMAAEAEHAVGGSSSSSEDEDGLEEEEAEEAFAPRYDLRRCTKETFAFFPSSATEEVAADSSTYGSRSRRDVDHPLAEGKVFATKKDLIVALSEYNISINRTTWPEASNKIQYVAKCEQ